MMAPHVTGWVGLVALSLTATAAVSSAATNPSRGITGITGGAHPTAAFLPRRRHIVSQAFKDKHVPPPTISGDTARIDDPKYISAAEQQLLCGIRGGGSEDASDDGSQSESESESEGYDTTTATSSTDDDDDDGYGDTYDQEEAEIIEGYYSNQMEGSDASTTDAAADGGNAIVPDASVDGGSSSSSSSSSTSSMEEGTAQSTAASDADDTDSTAISSTIPPEILTKRTSASDLRVAGVAHHHDGDLAAAADVFLRAAQELEAGIHILEESLLEEEEEQEPAELAEMVEEAATCRLHEALCHLKQQKYARCIQSCTAVLEDGVQVVPLEEDDEFL